MNHKVNEDIPKEHQLRQVWTNWTIRHLLIQRGVIRVTNMGKGFSLTSSKVGTLWIYYSFRDFYFRGGISGDFFGHNFWH